MHILFDHGTPSEIARSLGIHIPLCYFAGIRSNLPDDSS
jgi:hypothetical protein